jgi:hypothetical protein
MRDLKSPAPIADPGLFCDVRFEREQSADSFFEERGGQGGYVLLIPFQSRVLCREHQVQLTFLDW